jgi:phospholipid transport system substrate-binding protein
MFRFFDVPFPSRHPAALACLLLALLLFTQFLLAAPVVAGESPGQKVREHSELLLRTIDERRAEFRQSPALLQEFIRREGEQLFDRDYSARLVLGRHGRQADEAEVGAFAEALTNNLLNRYSLALLDIDTGIIVKIKAETPLQGGRIIRVATEIERRGGQPVPVDYLFRETAEGWRAFDVIVEGVSYVQTYRNQFDELLRRDSLPTLTQRLADGSLSVRD